MKKQNSGKQRANAVEKPKKRKAKEFEKGNHIRDLKIDLNINLFILGMMLLIFDCVFGVCALLMMYWVRIVWVWVIDIILVISALAHSIASMIYNKKNYYFRIYENCILLNSVWFNDTIVDFAKVKRIYVRHGFWDKIVGRKTCTLTIYLNDDWQTKINLYFLKEDPQQLAEELMGYTKKEFKQKSGN